MFVFQPQKMEIDKIMPNFNEMIPTQTVSEIIIFLGFFNMIFGFFFYCIFTKHLENIIERLAFEERMKLRVQEKIQKDVEEIRTLMGIRQR